MSTSVKNFHVDTISDTDKKRKITELKVQFIPHYQLLKLIIYLKTF